MGCSWLHARCKIMDKDYKKLLIDANTAKQEAVAAKELVNNIIARVNDGFVALDNNWNYTYVNERAARMLQRDSAAELIGKHIWTEYPEGIGQPFHKAYLRALKTQQPEIFEEYYAPWNQWYENRIYPSPDGLTIYFTDITERKKAEQCIKQTNRALKLLGHCNEALIHTNNEIDLLQKTCNIISQAGEYPLVCISVNEPGASKPLKIVAQTGFKEGQLDNFILTMSDANTSDVSVNTSENITEPVIFKDILKELVDPWWLETAKKYNVTSSVSIPIRTTEISFGYLTVFTDTANHINEDEIKLLQELSDNLSYGIATMYVQSERRQLQRQLRQAQKMQAIGQLTGGIAHDFNNILGCIMGYTELAIEHYAKEEGRLSVYLNEVYQAGKRARDLIQQMLAFSRNSASNTRIISIAPLVKEALSLLQSTLTSSITIQTDIEEDVSSISMDPGHLHQLVMNLCINARDALDGEGIIKIAISNVKQSRAECNSCHLQIDGDYVQLLVKDNGCGLEKDLTNRIFDPFFTTKDVGQGSGMGLSMVHGLVHEHSGHILLESKPGAGTTFRLLFPVAKADKKNLQIGNETYTPSDINKQHSGHLLVIDDEEPVAMLMAELLQLAGYQVTVVINSTEALALFKENHQYYDMVITDQTMPNITGSELATQMLKIKPETPIILCTGYSEKIDQQKADDIGIAKFLQKPISHKVLLDNIDRLLNKRIK